MGLNTSFLTCTLFDACSRLPACSPPGKSSPWSARLQRMRIPPRFAAVCQYLQLTVQCVYVHVIVLVQIQYSTSIPGSWTVEINVGHAIKDSKRFCNTCTIVNIHFYYIYCIYFQKIITWIRCTSWLGLGNFSLYSIIYIRVSQYV